MSRFNTAPPPPAPTTRTAQGGAGFERSPKEELFLLGITNFVGHSTFYESAASRDARQVELVHQVTATDPDWVAAYARWLRADAGMRTVSIVVAAEYAKAGGPNKRQVIASVLQRADEPAEMIGYWIATHGRNIPIGVKRGIADAVTRLYTQRNALRFDGSNGEYRWADVLRLAHPSPLTSEQSDLFRYVTKARTAAPIDVPESLGMIREDRRLMALPTDQRRANIDAAIANGWSWDRFGSWVGGLDADTWAAAIPNMGVMALLRNLRNFDEKNVTGPAVDIVKAKISNPADVRASRVFPLQFLSAARAVSSVRWLEALEAGLDAATDNVPALPGRTLILIDVSQSMEADLNVRRTDRGKAGAAAPDPLKRWEAAAVFGTALARRADNADVYLFNMSPTAQFEMGAHDSVLRQVDEVRKHVGGGTDTLASLRSAYAGHDRVVILTDEQTGEHGGQTYRYGAGTYTFTHWDAVADIRCPVLTWNLDGSKVGHTPRYKNWSTFGGLTDAAFNMIDVLERRRSGQWPWEVPPVFPQGGPLDG